MRRRSGFSLIELLVVVAILLVLIGLAVFVLSKVVGTTKTSGTGMVLQNLRTMMSEYEVATKQQLRQPVDMYWNGGKTAPGTVLNIWKDANPTDGTTAPEPDPAFAPVNVGPTLGLNPGFGRYDSDAVANTQLVIGLLQQVSSVKSMLSQLPNAQMMEEIPAGLATTAVKLTVANTIPVPPTVNYGGTAARPSPPIPLDSWGNPIIFVPAGGLCGTPGAGPQAMWIGGKAGETGAKRVVNKEQTALAADEIGPIRSPDGRSFWASAGPDGDFCTGDDNLYSFQN